MPHWIFTEDENGKFGCVGYRESRAAADQRAADFMGITHVKFYRTYNRVEAKRYFKGGRAEEDPGIAHRNISNRSTVGEVV